MPSAKNVSLVAQLEHQLAQAKALVLADYRGLSVTDIQHLKAKLRLAGGVLTVAKNTLIKLALKAKRQTLDQALEDALTGPTALILALEDDIAPIKTLMEFAHAHALNIPAPKAGLLNDKILTAADIETIASLPSKPQLLSQLLGQLQAPVSGFHHVLQANLRQLVSVLTAVKSKKEVN